MRPAWISACISALCALLGACTDSPQVIDPFPIAVDLGAGPSLLAASEDDTSSFEITVDVLSTITVIDTNPAASGMAEVIRRVADLTLYGIDASGTTSAPRVRFPKEVLYDFHPCGATPDPCKVGLGAGAREVFGVLGADIIADSSIRFDFPTSELRFFPDAAGSVAQRTLACDAVFERPYGGGGTLVVSGGEVRFGSNRPTLGACVHHSPIAEPEPTDIEVGTDMQLAISTGLGPTLLSTSAYQRYAASATDTVLIPALETLPTDTLYLLSGPVPVRMGEIAYSAFVGVVGDASNRRGPCRELYANARMRVAKSCSNLDVDCPCANSQASCKAAAAVEINRPIKVAIVDDTLPLLQSLRDELRPNIPELDGVIGVEALSALRVEFDYPNNRLLMRCLEPEFCTTRPQVRSQKDLNALDLCRAEEEADLPPLVQDAGPVP